MHGGIQAHYEIAIDIPIYGFDRIGQALTRGAFDFDKPVWLINGDQHDWYVLKPLTPGATHPRTELFGVPNSSVYRIHGEQYDAQKFTAFTFKSYVEQEGDDEDVAFEWLEIKARPDADEDIFAYNRHKVGRQIMLIYERRTRSMSILPICV